MHPQGLLQTKKEMKREALQTKKEMKKEPVRPVKEESRVPAVLGKVGK